MAEEQKTIELLRRKRGNVKASLTRLELYYSNITNETSSEELCIRLEMLEKAYNEFKDIDERLAIYPQQVSELAEFEQRYCDLKLKFREESKKRNNTFQDLHQQFSSTMQTFVQQQKQYFDTLQDRSFALHTNRDEVKLPKITIPPFSGNYSDFPSFKDLFEATIHNNESLSNVHKFKYLKGLLVGEAANIVKHISVTEANYEDTWQKIVDRYDHKDHIMTNLIRQFMAQPRIHGTSKDIRQMADVSDEVLRGIKALGTEAEARDGWLIHILLEKCDEETRKAWAMVADEKQFAKIGEFLAFLNKRSNALERAEPASKQIAKVSSTRITSTNVSVTVVCPLCSEHHVLYKCDKFLALDISSRRGFIAEKKLCFNCMRSNHRSQSCKFKIKCSKCNRKHNTLLHTDETNKSPSAAATHLVETHSGENLTQTSDSLNSMSTVSNYFANLNIQAILPTALIKIKDGLGQFQLGRALLDSGSQASFIDERFFKQLNLPKKNATLAISGLASAGTITKGVANVTIMPRFGSNSKKSEIKSDLFILDKLPLVLPSSSIKWNDINFICGLELADPNFHHVGKIDMLLGADIFFNVLRDGRKTSADGLMVAQNTLFGYIMSGRINSSSTISLNHISLDEPNLDEALRRFWEIEEIPNTKILHPEEVAIENHFIKNYKRNPDGRFIVKLPFKKDSAKLGNSLHIATKRFYNMEKKLQTNDKFGNDYRKFMAEYLELNHMRKIIPNDVHVPNEKCFYLPHHAVVKINSTTSKIRVVFDGSCKSTTGTSLNNMLMVGPTIQSSLWDILLRFRFHRYVVTADIEKMYRQILVSDEDANYQRILWRENPEAPLNHYTLTTVTYGTASAPFLATRCLHQLALDNMNIYSDAANIIQNDFYVDDLLTGCNSLELMLELKEIISNILKSGGFYLRKWSTNFTSIHSQDAVVNIKDETDTIKILGLQWFPNQDYFSFNVQDVIITSATKRNMLSDASKIFDPLGWLSPSTILVKVMFQQLWLQKLSWDDPLPETIKNDWLKIRAEFLHFQNLKIARWIPDSGTIEFHVFADASEKAYAAAVYCRNVSHDNLIQVQLVTAKTKVAPIKQKSLPRLELCAAVLATNLVTAVSNSMKHITHNVFAWSDSAIVLSWLSDHPSRWTSFIGNRTSQILTDCPRERWSHVKSSDNPADIASRGIVPSKLSDNKLWWHGPSWLAQQRSFWPKEGIERTARIQQSIQAEMKRRKANVCQTQMQHSFLVELVSRHSNYSKLIRVTAYVIRFTRIFAHKFSKRKETKIEHSYLTSKELEHAEEILIKTIQAVDFERDIERLTEKSALDKKSHLKSLNPFLDSNGILRVGGRLQQASCSYQMRHPIVLHKNSILSKIIVTHIHNKFLHTGPSLTFHLLRQKYWIINGRSRVNQIVRNCITCTRHRGQAPTQIMGQLPRVRITPARAFENTGVDLTGAIYLASKRGRGARLSKAYIAIFICLATKALHIEVVTAATADAFIAAFRRFIARRGLPSNMYSDNGTNFVGADKKLKQLSKLATKYLGEPQKMMSSVEFKEEVGTYLASNNIQWHYLPPLASHMAGIWESAVKSVKTHLAKATGNLNLTYEEMTTLLCNIEAILNSRPLTALSTNDDSYEAITPAHFLIGAPITSLPEPYSEENKINLSKMWSTIQHRTFTFWKRYSLEYIHSLQQRSKWQTTKSNVKVNDVVLIKEQYLPPCKWALGRIIKVHPGEDGYIRVVTIKTAHNTFKRPLSKIVLLPLMDY